jgi:hypothetical protein
LYSHDTGDVFYRFHASEWACTLLTSSNNNLFYQDGGGTKVFEGISGDDNWTQWKALCGNKYDDNTSTSDPLFVSVNNDNYNISQSSPAYNRGFVEIDQNMPGLNDVDFTIVQNLLATTGGDSNEIDLTWDTISGASRYCVKRSTTSCGSFSTAATPTAASYTDTGLTGGATYYYKVSAIISDVNQTASIEKSATAKSLASVIFFDGFESGDFSNWSSNADWDIATTAHTGSYSGRADSVSGSLAKAIDTSSYSTITLSFWYRDDDIDDDDQAFLRFHDVQDNNDEIFECGITSPEDTWHYYETTRTAAQYLHSGFKFLWTCGFLDSGEFLWIDDVEVRAQ